MTATLEDRILQYLAARMPELEGASIDALARIHGGASRETFRVRVRSSTGDVLGLIFRRDPVSTLIETQRELEFAAYRSFANTDVPVPRALFLERDTAWLDRPFFVMQEIEGCTAGSILSADPFGPDRQRVGAQFYATLGAIARRDVATSDLARVCEVTAPGACWALELAKWEKVIDEDELEPQPVARAAIRWMRANPPPPPPRVCVVHGDYRNGNFLVDGKGNIRAILDWEMAHLGDPLEDLAWALDPLWSADRENPGGMLPRDVAVRTWEAASGMTADPVALAWWSMFAALKGSAIWISSAKEYESGSNIDPVMAFSGMYCLPFHTDRLAKMLLQARGGAA